MPKLDGDPDLDIILTAFSESCPIPDARELGSWIARHPDHAEDLVIHAAVAIAADVRNRQIGAVLKRDNQQEGDKQMLADPTAAAAQHSDSE